MRIVFASADFNDIKTHRGCTGKPLPRNFDMFQKANSCQVHHVFKMFLYVSVLYIYIYTHQVLFGVNLNIKQEDTRSQLSG